MRNVEHGQKSPAGRKKGKEKGEGEDMVVEFVGMRRKAWSAGEETGEDCCGSTLM